MVRIKTQWMRHHQRSLEVGYNKMISESDYINTDAVGLGELVKNKEVTPTELLDVALRRLERINPEINAVINLFEDLARDQISNGVGDGPFEGVPFLLKDLRASYKGTENTAGNAFMATTPDFDSEVTLRYKKAGLVMFGKTNVPEMGLAADTYNTLFGPTSNPWSPEHTSGGSSGGSAAAVAARIVPAAHGSDGMGSIRIPSSCCGVVGLKPSKGRVTYGPDVGDELIGMSTQHVCTWSVRDSAAMLDATAMPDYGDPYWAPPAPASYLELTKRDPKQLRIALCNRPPIDTDVHPECITATTQAAKLCESMGHIVEETDLGIHWEEDGLAHATTVILGVGMYANVKSKAKLKGLPDVRESDFLPAIWSFLEAGLNATGADFYLASRKTHEIGRRLASFHEKYDVILSPTLSQPPLPRSSFDYTTGEGYTDHVWDFSAYTPLYNVTGQPAITLPLHWTSQGLPVGVQFAARFGGEDILLQLAGQIERAQPWRDRLPALAKAL